MVGPVVSLRLKLGELFRAEKTAGGFEGGVGNEGIAGDLFFVLVKEADQLVFLSVAQREGKCLQVFEEWAEDVATGSGAFVILKISERFFAEQCAHFFGDQRLAGRQELAELCIRRFGETFFCCEQVSVIGIAVPLDEQVFQFSQIGGVEAKTAEERGVLAVQGRAVHGHEAVFTRELGRCQRRREKGCRYSGGRGGELSF